MKRGRPEVWRGTPFRPAQLGSWPAQVVVVVRCMPYGSSVLAHPPNGGLARLLWPAAILTSTLSCAFGQVASHPALFSDRAHTCAG